MLSPRGRLCPLSEPEGTPAPCVGTTYSGVVLRSALFQGVSPGEYLPEFHWGRLLTDWGLDPFPFILAVWVSGLYLIGVRTLHRRGDRWPVGRTIAFVGVGMGSFLYATTSALAIYDTTLLSVHMLQHMILSMIVPLALALGAPVTLALRTLPPKGRRWLTAVLHSRFVKVLSFPPLAFGVYVLSPWALYFTSWYDASLSSTYVHEMMHVHLVLVGSLFFWPIMGVDPVPGRVAYPFRLLLIVLTLPFHSFLGITVMNQSTLIGGEHYMMLRDGPMGTWLPDAAADQHLSGAILWASGDLIAVGFFFVLFAQWVRDAMKEGAREDRRLDRLEARERAALREGGSAAVREG